MATTHRRIGRLIRAANGSSQPWFCLLDDETSWLVKFSGAGPGREALLAEHVANSLGRLWGLPIPESKPVMLDSSVPRAGTDEFWDVLAASEGWNLAIQTIPNAVDLIPDTDLPQSTLESMLSFDALMANWDRTALSRNLMRDETGFLWWIDHGSCRFLHELTSRQPPVLPTNHFLSDVQGLIEPAPLPLLERSCIEDRLADLPEQWLAGTGHDRTRLCGELVDYLQHALT